MLLTVRVVSYGSGNCTVPVTSNQDIYCVKKKKTQTKPKKLLTSVFCEVVCPVNPVEPPEVAET